MDFGNRERLWNQSPGDTEGLFYMNMCVLMYLVLRNKKVLSLPDDQSSFLKMHIPEHHPEYLGKHHNIVF